MDGYGIYPKQYRNAFLPIEKNRCFMLMPFSSKFDLVYGEIKSALTKEGLVCNRADEIFGSVPIMGTVLKEILKAHFIIADLTGQNANVFYELGVAHSFKDAQNIVIISQTLDDVPFDIRHLGAIIYDTNNLKHLTSRIRQTISDNSYYFEFFESLQRNNIISSIHADMDDFVDHVAQRFGQDIQAATGIISGAMTAPSEDVVRRILDAAVGLFYSTTDTRPRVYLNGVIQIIGTILANTREYKYSGDVFKHLLFELDVDKLPLTRNEIIRLKSILAVQIASENAFFDDALSWIIAYFSKSKSATVDLNRYHLERFLLTSDNSNVDEAIVNSVLHENYYVREHMADIVGEKKIVSGLETLVAQLKREQNIYATSSIITALGKLGRTEAYPAIRDWLTKNEKKILDTKHFFVLKHIYIAFINMGVSDEYVASFEKKFSPHISHGAVF